MSACGLRGWLRDGVYEAVAVGGNQAKRSDGKLPPHVMAYFAMAIALFADEGSEEVLTRQPETLVGWGRWDVDWQMPGSGGVTQARRPATCPRHPYLHSGLSPGSRRRSC